MHWGCDYATATALNDDTEVDGAAGGAGGPEIPFSTEGAPVFYRTSR